MTVDLHALAAKVSATANPNIRAWMDAVSDILQPTAPAPAPTPTPTPTPTPAPSTVLLGVYEGSADNAAKVTAFEQWTGKPVDLVLDFVAQDSWTDFVNDSSWLLGEWASAGRKRLVLTVPMCCGAYMSDSAVIADLKKTAAGGYDAYYAGLRDKIASTVGTGQVIRLAHEFNGGWYNHRAAPSTSDWVAAWRHVAGILRTVALMDWCPTWGWNQVQWDKCWPGDDVVDICGFDCYDQLWASGGGAYSQDGPTRWKETVAATTNGGYGLASYLAFAKSHGKPVAFDEWGVALRGDTPEHGGGDNPTFVTNMLALAKGGGFHHATYFNAQADVKSQIYPVGLFPKASAAYKAAV